MMKLLTVVVCLLLLTAKTCHGSKLASESDAANSQESTLGLYSGLIVSVIAVICIILIIVGCASLCPTQTPEFKDFDNDGFFQDVTIEPPTTNFAMIPPAIDSSDTVHFDPLPDVSIIRQRQQSLSTPTSPTSPSVMELRPRVSQIGHERVESDDEGEVQTREAVALQERVKLEKLLLNARHKLARNQLQYLKEMGTSWFGKVLLAEGQDILPGHKKSRVVIQMLHENADQHMQYVFLQESAPYREMDHVNVLKMLGHCVETTPFLTLLELCPLGDLKTYLRNRRSDHEAIDKQGLLLNMACDMASGLQAMHHSNFVHRDFAIRNCLVSTDLSIKVGDYGLAEELFKEDYYFASNGDGIPIRWLAPEVIDTTNGHVSLRHITKDCNLWSFGVALWELVTFGALPYGDLNNEQVVRQVICDNNVRLCQPEVPVSNLGRLYQLMSLCWLAPAQRPSLRELRIMLLHLRSSRDELDPSASAEFDRKWNQLMPRSANHIPVVMSPMSIDSDDDEVDMSFTLSHIHPRPVTAVPSEIRMLPGIHSASATILPGLSYAARPASFDSEFGGSELNASLLAQPGSLQESLRSSSNSPGNTPDETVLSHTVPKFSFQANELSLASELGLANAAPAATFEMVGLNDDGEAEVSAENTPTDLSSLNLVSVPGVTTAVIHNRPSTSESLPSLDPKADPFDDDEWQSFSGGRVSVTESAAMSQSHCEVHTTKQAGDAPDVGTGQSSLAATSSETGGGGDADNRDGVKDKVSTGTGTPSPVTSRETIDDSFCVFGSGSPATDESPAKSCDLESPVKSTTSSADWYLVSSATEHSKDEDFDRTSRITEHSLPSDCVLVTDKSDALTNVGEPSLSVAADNNLTGNSAETDASQSHDSAVNVALDQ